MNNTRNNDVKEDIKNDIKNEIKNDIVKINVDVKNLAEKCKISKINFIKSTKEFLVNNK